MSSSSIDHVLSKFSQDNINLKVRDVKEYVLIHGTKRELEFLAAIILAHAYDKDPDHVAALFDSTNDFFHKDSDKGICIYREEGQ